MSASILGCKEEVRPPWIDVGGWGFEWFGRRNTFPLCSCAAGALELKGSIAI